MSPWERSFFRLLLQTTRRPTDLPLARLTAELDTQRPHIRTYWKPENRMMMAHLMISTMRERACPRVLIGGHWQTLIAYIDESWRLYAPGRPHKIRVKHEFLEFKKGFDLDTTKH